jgi:putative inorganic carbon (hco3(-)) transporter
MRDLLLVAIIAGSSPFILRRPYIGVLVYVWLSVMNPHRLTWGFTYGFSFAIIIGAVTLISVLLNMNKDVKPPPMNALMVALILFAAWTGVTTVFSLYPTFDKWQSLMKTQLIVVLIPMLFHRKEEVRQLLWVIVLSIAYYGTKGGVWILLTGGGEKVWGPEGSYITDNNALAATIVMTIPLMRYLQLTSPHRYVQWGLTAMMMFCGAACSRSCGGKAATSCRFCS